MTGTKKSVQKVATSRPPMTALPSGAFCSPPSPKPRDNGSMPMIIAVAVIITGRSRVYPALSAAFVPGEVNQQDAVGRGYADRHYRAHHRGDADGRLRRKQHPDDAGDRPGQS